MKKDLVSKVLAVVLLSGFFGWFTQEQLMLDIKNMESMPIAEVAKKAMIPVFATKNEAVLSCIAIGVTVVILTELLGFFIRIIFFRRIDETNIIHNHNITLQLASTDDIKSSTTDNSKPS